MDEKVYYIEEGNYEEIFEAYFNENAVLVDDDGYDIERDVEIWFYDEEDAWDYIEKQNEEE